MTSRTEVVATALQWENVKFQRHGVTRLGCDCCGLFIGIGLELGLEGFDRWQSAIDMHGYGFPPDPAKVIAGAESFLGDRVDPRGIAPSDILILRFAREPVHFAMVISIAPTYIVHAMSTRGVKHHRLPTAWKERIARAHRLRGVAA